MTDERVHGEGEDRSDLPEGQGTGPGRARRGGVIRPFTPFPVTPWSFERTQLPRLGRGRLWAPRVDVSDRGNVIVVTAELPGVEARDVHISVDRDVMTIQGERQQSVEVRGERYYRRERSYGRFRRDIKLPGSVNPEGVEAEFRRGVLMVSLPKDRSGGRGRIEVRET